MTKAVTPEADEYLIRKNGYWYRPNAQGYTLSKDEAGRFTLEEAIRHSHPNGPDGPRDGISYEPTLPATLSPPTSGEEMRLREALERAVLWARDDKCSYGDSEKFEQRIDILRAALAKGAE